MKTMSNKAWFKATREMCGLSQQDVADDLGISVKSVKRWENPEIEGYEPPAFAIGYMEEAKRSFSAAVETVVGIVDEMPEGLDSVQITYYRDQAMYDEHGRDEGSFSHANAISRAVAAIIEMDGTEVEWVYPTDAGRIPVPREDIPIYPAL